MNYVAAVASFVIAFFVATIAYAELAPRILDDLFRDRPTALLFVIVVICLIAAVRVFQVVG